MKVILIITLLILFGYTLYNILSTTRYTTPNEMLKFPRIIQKIEKIKKVEPKIPKLDPKYVDANPTKSINTLLRTGDIQSLFIVGNHYRFGIGDLSEKQNLYKAQEIYKKILKNGNKSDKAKALRLLNEINFEIYVQRQNEENNKEKIRMLKIDEIIPNNRDEVLEIALLNDILINPVRRNDPLKEIIEKPVWDDEQNVHNPVMIRSAKDMLNKVDSGGVVHDNMFTDITNEILTRRNSQGALKTLNDIRKNKDKNISLNKTDGEILKTVWDRINDPMNRDRRSDMIDILVEQLNDGRNVCLMGKTLRILSVLDGTDIALELNGKPSGMKTDSVIKEEIQNTIAHTYTTLLNNTTPEMKVISQTLEENMNDEDKILFTQFKEQFRNNLTERLYNDYKDSTVLNSDEINAHIEVAVNAI